MAKFSIKRFGRKCGEFFENVVLTFIFGVCVGVWLVLISIIAIIWGVIKWLLFWNPICFFVWANIAPRKMAQILYAPIPKPDEGAKYKDFKEIFAMIKVVRNYLCGWQRHLLPMKSKRWFVLEKPESFKCAVRIKAFRSFFENGMKPEAKELLSKVSEKTLAAFLERYYPSFDEKKIIIPLKKELTAEDIRFLLTAQVNCSAVEETYMKNTPSQRFMNILLDVFKGSYNLFCENLIIKCLWRDGMSTETLNRVLCIEHQGVKDKLLKVVRIRGEVQLVKMLASWGSAGKQEWSKFLSDMPELFAESEKEMSVSMMELFYKSEHHLHEENVLYFLSGVGGSASTIEAYRKFVLTNEDLKQPALDYIKSNAEVYRLYLQIKA
ncbi:MAG: hypothetical protein J6039_06245 [Alphaproteobacteria bacterium]|nr:hypothetical protein [Alphaproteobacteria bacterium]